MSKERTDSLRRIASWVIRVKETKEVICETFNPQLVAALNSAKYEAIPILEYLQSLNHPKSKVIASKSSPA